MKLPIQVSRAIAAEFASRKVKSVVVPAIVILVVVNLVIAWAVAQSAWWLLLALPIALVTLLTVVAVTVLAFAVRLAKPNMSSEQRSSVASFVDKLERVLENVQTPIPFIVIRIMWDSVTKSKEPLLKTFVKDSTSLQKDTAHLQRIF